MTCNQFIAAIEDPTNTHTTGMLPLDPRIYLNSINALILFFFLYHYVFYHNTIIKKDFAYILLKNCLLSHLKIFPYVPRFFLGGILILHAKKDTFGRNMPSHKSIADLKQSFLYENIIRTYAFIYMHDTLY